jgi:uncharacterized membrane protein (UPF0127 family)
MLTLFNARTQATLATTVAVADTRATRRKGLLGRRSMGDDEAMVISPCMAVHTAFMQFPIDVVFVDRGGRAVQIVHHLPPWRVAASLRARAVIEMPAGRARAGDIQLGDRLTIAASRPDPPAGS